MKNSKAPSRVESEIRRFHEAVTLQHPHLTLDDLKAMILASWLAGVASDQEVFGEDTVNDIFLTDPVTGQLCRDADAVFSQLFASQKERKRNVLLAVMAAESGRVQ